LAARAATSVYATLGVAAATLVVVGAIIAGPSILDCSKDPGGFGACLRDKLGDSGLTTSDVSSELPPAGGWMEAVANEYEPPVSTPVELEGTPADLLAEAAISSVSAAVEVAVAPAAELATLAPAQEEVAVSVALVGPEGALSVDVAVANLEPDTTVALSEPVDGTLVAETPSEAVVDVAVAIEPIDPADDLTSAVEPPPSEPAPVELSAEPLPPEPSSEPVLPPQPEPPAPFSSEPAIVIEFNPNYPNVIVLPPPTEGDNSSIRTLQLN
jgi:hypothetical protein